MIKVTAIQTGTVRWRQQSIATPLFVEDFGGGLVVEASAGTFVKLPFHPSHRLVADTVKVGAFGNELS